MDAIFILAIALLLDLTLGDPPTAFHPVGWMGKTVSLMERLVPQGGPNVQFFYGAWIVVFGAALFAIPSLLLLIYLDDVSRVAYIVVAALLLKSTFSIRGLRRYALQVKSRLLADDLNGARDQTGALVSRDVENLSPSLVVAATVESVSENTSDSIVAPLFWFLVLGVPGAVAYRMINTFDSMIGYHDDDYEFLGKFAARADDVLNYVPARLTGLLLVVAAVFRGSNGAAAWRVMLRDHAKTESPNAGYPMSAAAGALGVRLEKVNHYELGDAIGALTPETIDAMLRLMVLAVAVWLVICFGLAGVDSVLAS